MIGANLAIYLQICLLAKREDETFFEITEEKVAKPLIFTDF
jgi:hypothetical protein